MPTILNATEDRAFNQILETALGSEGHTIVSVRDGATALRSAVAEQAELLVMDVSLPRMDGLEVLAKLRRGDSPAAQAAVILMTNGGLADAERDRAAALGVAAILDKPARLDVLLKAVRSALKDPEASFVTDPGSTGAGAGTNARPGARGRSGPGKEPPPLAGTLAQVRFSQLLHHLHGLRATGALLLGNAKKKKAIEVRDGYPVAVKSNLVGECLGNYLVRMRRLTKAQHDESIQRLRRGEGLQGQILVAMELLDEEELAAALHDQALEKLHEIFEWRNGSFKFQLGGRLQKANTLAVKESPANLILVGVRERVPVDEIDGYLGEHEERRVSRATSPFYRFQEIDLGSDERTLLERADGRMRVAQLAQGSPVLRRQLYALLVTGLLEFAESKASVGVSPPAPTRRPAPVEPADLELDRALRRELAAMAEGLKGKNFFEMLGLGEDATDEAVAIAYEELASRTHSDRFHNASGAARELAGEVHDLVSQAHEALSNLKGRQNYILELRRGEREVRAQEKDRIALEAETHFQRGEALLRKREYEQALEAFGRALERFPDEGEYHAHYGWCLHLCHPDNEVMIQEAMEHVRRGVALARDREKPYLYLGRLYKAVGRGSAAEKMFTRALQIRPECVEAMRELRLINLRREKSRGLIERLMRKVKS